MDIRTITVGLKNGDNNIDNIQLLINKIRNFKKERGQAVTTARLVGEPFIVDSTNNISKSLEIFEKFEQFRLATGLTWFCIPIKFEHIQAEEILEFLNIALKKYPNAFINFQINMDNPELMNLAGKIIQTISFIEPGGFANFRFAFSLNMQAHNPFFPSSFHEGKSGFSIAYEMLPLVTEILKNNTQVSSSRIKEILIEAIADKAAEDLQLFKSLENESSIHFYGADFSLAPLPVQNTSIVDVLDLLKENFFPSARNMFLTYFLTDLIKSVAEKCSLATGFNGVFYSLLEDKKLSVQNLEAMFNIDTLLAYSTMCGCGLDMLPLCGDVSEQKIIGLLGEIFAISKKYSKPLICRLLPIPGKKENDLTDFHHDFLTNTRILSI